jgi:predicted nucleic-acid-binding Zn-ribbon protein
MVKEITIKKTYKELTCNRCKYSWYYGGASKWITTCPKCKTTVTINPKIKKKQKEQTK